MEGVDIVMKHQLKTCEVVLLGVSDEGISDSYFVVDILFVTVGRSVESYMEEPEA